MNPALAVLGEGRAVVGVDRHALQGGQRPVYFFSQAITPEEAEAEAAYVLNAVAGYEIAYPIAFEASGRQTGR